MATSPLLPSLPYYDSLMTTGTTTRRGNVRIKKVDPDLHDGHGEIAICNLETLLAFTFADRPGQRDNLSAYENAMAVLLAAHHLNTGNATVVHELEGLNEKCNVRFITNLYDSQFEERHTVETVIRQTDNSSPCAFLGAQRSAVSIPMAIITGLRGYLQISAFSTSPALNANQFPLFGRTIPADDATAVPVILYFKSLQIKHVGVVYVNDSFGSSFFAGLQLAIQQEAPEIRLIAVDLPFAALQSDFERVISALKASEVRYFFAIVLGQAQNDELMREAYRQGIAGTGEHTWIFSQSPFVGRNFEPNDVVLKSFLGGGIITASGGIPEEIPVLRSFLASHYELANVADLSYMLNKTDFDPLSADQILQDRPQWGSPIAPFCYDMVVAAGLAACEAISQKGSFNGTAHYNAFAKLNFTGASGRNLFDSRYGSREPTSAFYTISNLGIEPTEGGLLRAVDVKSGIFEEGQWRTLRPFVYGDGTTVQHNDLPSVDLNENLLSKGWRAAGLVMCCIALVSTFGFTTWTLQKRNTRVVRASQPIFLLLICLGVFLFSLSIIPLSFDLGIASQRGCSIACSASVWLISTGFSVSFSALFTKTYRVRKIVHQPQFRRIKVTALDVMKPMLVILGANLLILSIMSALRPVRWVVAVVERDQSGRPIETVGSCDWLDSVAFLAPLCILNFCCLSFAVAQAYRARKISTELQESEYIFKSMLVILLACFLGFPILILTQENPAAFYFVLSATIFIARYVRIKIWYLRSLSG